MLTIKGHYKDGVVYPAEAPEIREEQDVMIIFPSNEKTLAEVRETDYDALTKLIEECQMETGISDLAYQHDHYLYGTPKRPE